MWIYFSVEFVIWKRRAFHSILKITVFCLNGKSILRKKHDQFFSWCYIKFIGNIQERTCSYKQRFEDSMHHSLVHDPVLHALNNIAMWTGNIAKFHIGHQTKKIFSIRKSDFKIKRRTCLNMSRNHNTITINKNFL